MTLPPPWCERCQKNVAKDGERFCPDCRKAVLKELRAKHRDEPVRTLSRLGTEEIGRPGRPWIIAGLQDEDVRE
jgi:hypothetical protein